MDSRRASLFLAIFLFLIASVSAENLTYFNDTKQSYNLSFTSAPQNQTLFLNLLQGSNVTNAILNLTGFPLQINFSYVANANSFNMTDGCNGLIGFAPNSTLPLTVCLQDSSSNVVSGSCLNYSSGNITVGSVISTATFNSSLLTSGQNYSVKFTWRRIIYNKMNDSSLNGLNDSGKTATGTHYPLCYANNQSSTDNSGCGVTVYTRYDFSDALRVSLNSNCLGMWIEGEGSGKFGYFTSDSSCSGNGFTGAPTYVGYTTTGRIAENQIANVGSNAIITSCTNIYYTGAYIKPFNEACTCTSISGDNRYVGSGCTAGGSDFNSSLCSYAGTDSITGYSSSSSVFAFNPSQRNYSVNFTDNLLSVGNVSINGNYPTNVSVFVNGSSVYSNLTVFNYSSPTFANLSVASINLCLINSSICAFNFQSLSSGILQVNSILFSYRLPNFTAIIKFNGSNNWVYSTSSGFSTQTEDFGVFNEGSFNASNCSFSTTGGLSPFLVANGSFNLTVGNSLVKNVSFAGVPDGSYSESLIFSCAGDVNNTIFNSAQFGSVVNVVWSVSTPVAVNQGGGGGSIIVSQGNGTFKLSSFADSSSYSLVVFPSQKRTREIRVTNLGANTLTVDLFCKGAVCDWVSIADSSLTITPVRSNFTSTTFTVSVPEGVKSGKYDFNIVGKADGEQVLPVTVYVSEGSGVFYFFVGKFLDSFSIDLGRINPEAQSIEIPKLLPISVVGAVLVGFNVFVVFGMRGLAKPLLIITSIILFLVVWMTI